LWFTPFEPLGCCVDVEGVVEPLEDFFVCPGGALDDCPWWLVGGELPAANAGFAVAKNVPTARSRVEMMVRPRPLFLPAGGAVMRGPSFMDCPMPLAL
jgi:hypothetical protein